MPDPADGPASVVASDPLDAFVALSAILTGIPGTRLHPFLDTHGTAEAYLTYVTDRAPIAFARLMGLYAQNPGDPDPAIAALIMSSKDAEILYLARAIVLMWYLGAWYAPTDLQNYVETCGRLGPTDPAPLPPDHVVISADAYTQGWAWQVGQAHPMGYSDLRFGYWNGAPPPLKDLVGA